MLRRAQLGGDSGKVLHASDYAAALQLARDMPADA
jgi:hypothetical protein